MIIVYQNRMKFCNVCDNMYYIGISEKDANQLTHYCRNCGNKDDTADTENVCVLKTQLKRGEQKFNHIINQYTKHDPTLPRIYTMKCPNIACNTNTDDGKEKRPCEIIYIRYDDDNMKYLYMCVECDNVWKTDDSK
jgi:DNA-directed RNA polymerase subunit M/transcription elongation factor TFIIS